jgi:hypothetical protein
MYTTHSHTLPLRSVFYAHNAQAHMLIFTAGGYRRSRRKPLEHRREQHNSHMVSAELEPVTQIFGTTVVKDDALAAYATHATQTELLTGASPGHSYTV